MANNQKLNITIAGNTVELDKSLKNINAALSNSKKEAQALQKDLKLDPGNVDIVTKRHGELTQALKLSQEKTKMLKDELKGIDPDVDPSAFFKLQKAVNVAEREARTLQRQFDVTTATLSRLGSMSASFTFDPGDGVREFQNSLQGVNAALSTLGNTKELVNFNPAKATTEQIAQNIGKIDKASELLTRKAELLKSELSAIDVTVDPAAFEKIQQQLNKTYDDLQALNNAKINIPVTVGTVDVEFGDGIIKFRNDIDGIKAAVSTLGDMDDLLTFDAGSMSLQDMQDKAGKLTQAIGLTSQKIDILKANLAKIDPQVDPSAFVALSQQIADTEADLRRLDEKKVTVDLAINSSTYNIRDIAGRFSEKLKTGLTQSMQNVSESVQSQIGSIFSPIGERVKQTVDNNVNPSVISAFKRTSSAVGSALSTVGDVIKHSLSRGVASGAAGVESEGSSKFSDVGSKLAKSLGNGLSVGGEALASIGSGLGSKLKSAVLAPFSALGSGLNTIVTGGLLTVGNKMTEGFGNLVSGVVGSMQEASTAGKTLENVLKFSGVNDEVIAKITTDLGEYAKTTTFASSSLNKVVGSLSAAGVEASKTADLTKALGNSYALLGDGSRDIADIGVIFSQINSATKLTAEDFNQLRDAGIGGALKKEIEAAFPDIIQQFGSFSNAMSEGAISAEMVNDAITKIGNSDAAVKAATIPKTMGEAFAGMNETIGQELQGVFESVNKKGIDLIQSITAKIEGLDLSGIAEKAIPVLESVFGMIGEKINLISSIISNIDFTGFSEKIKGIFNAISAEFAEVFAPEKINGYTSGLMSAVSQIGEALGSLLHSIDFGEILSAAISVFNSLVGVVGGVASTIAGIFGDETFKKSLSGAFVGLLDVLDDIVAVLNGGALQSYAQYLGTTFVQALQLVLSVAGDITKMFLALTTGLDFSPITSAISTLFDVAKNFLDAAIQPISDKLEELATNGTIQSIWKNLGKLGETFKALLKVIEPVTTLIGQLLGHLASEFVEVVIQNLDMLAQGLGALADFLTEVFKAISKYTDSAFEWLAGIFGFEASSVGSASSYSTYSTVGYSNNNTTTNNNVFNVTAPAGMNVHGLAREIRHSFELGVV